MFLSSNGRGPRPTQAFRRWALALLALTLAAAACSSGDDDSSANPGGDSNPSGIEGQPDPEAEIVIHDASFATHWDAHAYPSLVLGNTYLDAVYDRLLYLDENYDLQPGLATEWEFSDDATVLTMQLREGVTFHDGEAFDASVVVANMERAKGLDGTTGQAQASVIESVVALGDYEVEFTLSEPVPLFPVQLAYYPQIGSIISPAGLANPDGLQTQPAGSGLYELSSQGEDRSVYVKSDDYWDADLVASAPRQVTVMNVALDAAFNLLETGDIQGMYPNIVSPEYQDLVAGGGFELVTHSGRAEQLYMNFDSEPLQDVLVRQAIGLALEREATNQGVYEGLCPPTATGFLPGETGYFDGLAEYDERVADIDAAVDLLEQAGYGPGELSLSLVTSNSVHLSTAATIVQAHFDEVGINLEVLPIPGTDLLPTWRSGDHDFLLGLKPLSPDPQFWFDDYYLGLNAPGGIPDDLRSLVEDAMPQPFGSDERAEAWEAVAAHLAEDPVNPTVCAVQTLHLVDERLTGIADSTAFGAWNIRQLAYISG